MSIIYQSLRRNLQLVNPFKFPFFVQLHTRKLIYPFLQQLLQGKGRKNKTKKIENQNENNLNALSLIAVWIWNLLFFAIVSECDIKQILLINGVVSCRVVSRDLINFLLTQLACQLFYNINMYISYFQAIGIRLSVLYNNNIG